jgi:Ca2+-binding EF-hand superfamily protein
MKTLMSFVTLTCTALALPLAAQAQSYDQMVAALTQRFAKSDVNKDGKLTKQEATNGGMSRVASNFASIDTDKDGFVTLDQIKAQLAARNR